MKKSQPPPRSVRSVEEVLLRRKTNAHRESSLPPLAFYKDSVINSPSSSNNTGRTLKAQNVAELLQTTMQTQQRYGTNPIDELLVYVDELQRRNEELEFQLARGWEYADSANFTDEEPLTAMPMANCTVSGGLHTSANQPKPQLQMQTSTSTLGSQRSKQPRQQNRLVSNAVQDQFGSSITQLQHRVQALREVFLVDDVRIRSTAIIKIQAGVRGFVYRRRYKKFRAAISTWRINKSGHAVAALQQMLSRAAEIASNVNRSIVRLNMAAQTKCFRAWSQQSRATAPLRRERNATVTKMVEARNKTVLKERFMLWKVYSEENNQLLLQHKDKINKVRQALWNVMKDTGQVGVVTDEMVQDQIHKDIVSELDDKKARKLLQKTFDALAWAVADANSRLNIAKRHYFKKLCQPIMLAWHRHAEYLSMGMQPSAFRGDPGKGFYLRFNPRTVQAFTERRLMKKVLYPWKRYAYVRTEARRRQKHKQNVFVKVYLAAWHQQIKSDKALKVKVLDEWMQYAATVTFRPFYTWREHVRAVKRYRKDRARIVDVYKRWKMRKFLTKILKLWRHQALYGRLDGLYTRQNLLRTIAEQKQLTWQLEYTISAQTTEVETLTTLVGKQQARTEELQAHLETEQLEHSRVKMAMHNAEQELLRYKSMMDAMKYIYPKPMEHFAKLQHEFDFKNRGLEELAGIITQKDKKQLSDGIAQSSTESMLGSGVPGDGKSVESGGAAGSTTLEVANDDAALLVRAKFMVYLRERIVVDEQSHRPESRQFKPEEVLQSMAASVHFLTNGDLSVLSKEDEVEWLKFCVEWNNQERQTQQPSPSPTPIETGPDLFHDDIVTWNDVMSNLNTIYPSPSSTPTDNSLNSRFVSVRDGLIEAVRIRQRKGLQYLGVDDEPLDNLHIYSNRVQTAPH